NCGFPAGIAALRWLSIDAPASVTEAGCFFIHADEIIGVSSRFTTGGNSVRPTTANCGRLVVIDFGFPGGELDCRLQA
ncbi:MAG: hypothetical protein AB8B96_09885, partial [Lysobacterales bacterium]